MGSNHLSGLKSRWPLDLFTRLESVLFGKRNLGQQVLEIVVSGYNISDAAGAAFRREIAGMIQPHA
jgi:hypothetical protein